MDDTATVEERLESYRLENAALRDECERLKTHKDCLEVDTELILVRQQLATMTQERNMLKDLSNVTEDDLGKAGKWKIAHPDLDAEWRKDASRDNILAMYDCSVSNWSICLGTIDKLEQQLTASEQRVKELEAFIAREND